ncbi:MAG TPA: hypothetical protein VLY23_03900 [Candidatus Acidoferrum sp.]|nr:hypothetical protein [Candidatus Acidoferrum sp.]
MTMNLAAGTCGLLVRVLLQEPGAAGWQLNQTWVEPILAVKLYVLLVFVSLIVAIAQILKNWILVRPLRTLRPEVDNRAATAFRRQALSLRRWMVLNTLAWGGVTVAGVANLFRGVSVSRTVGMQVISGGLEEVLQPSGLFFLTLIILYVARWHILWRAEGLERQHREPRAGLEPVADIIRRTED